MYKQGSSAVYNEQFKFNFVLTRTGSTVMKVRVYDSDTLSNDFLGAGEIDLLAAASSSKVKAVRCVNDKGKPSGQVMLKVERNQGITSSPGPVSPTAPTVPAVSPQVPQPVHPNPWPQPISIPQWQPSIVTPVPMPWQPQQPVQYISVIPHPAPVLPTRPVQKPVRQIFGGWAEPKIRQVGVQSEVESAVDLVRRSQARRG
jgi:hypothetical protein